jgi:Xaa-Pro aminopeptidase
LYLGKEALTSEHVRKEVEKFYLDNGLSCLTPPIISCGKDSALPHSIGQGRLRANQPIILDFFPYSKKTGYFSDMTRTVVKGKASRRLKQVYDSVRSLQDYALKKLKPGINIKQLTLEIRHLFNSDHGFSTDLSTSQGFIHSLGHGVGLDIHEQPMGDKVLEEGDIFTIEPGLYYKRLGGVRLEDIVLITNNGMRNLTRFPHYLEV